MLKTILVTGGAGFIGSAVCRRLVGEGYRVLNVDALTYAADLKNLESVEDEPNYRFLHADICDRSAMDAAFVKWTRNPHRMVGFDVRSHVVANPNKVAHGIDKEERWN